MKKTKFLSLALLPALMATFSCSNNSNWEDDGDGYDHAHSVHHRGGQSMNHSHESHHEKRHYYSGGGYFMGGNYYNNNGIQSSYPSGYSRTPAYRNSLRMSTGRTLGHNNSGSVMRGGFGSTSRSSFSSSFGG